MRCGFSRLGFGQLLGRNPRSSGVNTCAKRACVIYVHVIMCVCMPHVLSHMGNHPIIRTYSEDESSLRFRHH